MNKKQRTNPTGIIHPNAAGLDIGSREIWACVSPDQTEEAVRRFSSFTPDLHQLADWLEEMGVDTVAMESTGVYWIPIFEILEARGMDAYLVNGRHIKQVPGRKSDVLDCQWIQKLHSLGLLSASFRPDYEMCALRAYLRHRDQIIQHRTPHILHMQKALQYMNVQLPQVLTNTTGATGMAIIRAIVAGERNPITLAQLRDPKCHSSQEEFVKALTGDWKDEQLFILQQSLALYDFYTEQLQVCDQHIQQHYAAMKPRWEGQPEDVNQTPRPARRVKNEPTFDVRTEVIRLTGVDLVAVPGIGPAMAQVILAEIGTDMGRWPTDKHFASWLGLAPHNDISGGKVLRSRILPSQNRAGQAFRQAAATVSRGPTAFGAFYRRKRVQGGPCYAQVATAHKIARTVYHLLKYRVQYVEMGAEAYQQKQREREVAALHRKARKLGFTLMPPGTSQLAGCLTS
jgi:transposase